MLLFHSGVQQHPILSIEEKASRVLSLAHGHRWKCAYGFDFRFDSRDVALEGGSRFRPSRLGVEAKRISCRLADDETVSQEGGFCKPY